MGHLVKQKAGYSSDGQLAVLAYVRLSLHWASYVALYCLRSRMCPSGNVNLVVS